MQATPSFTERAHRYCRAVLSGEILACKQIKYAAKRHLEDLDRTDARWLFDSTRVEQCCRFIQSLTLSNGEPFRLSEWQVWIVASLIGWVDSDGLRKYIEALVLVPKGNGKSPLAAALGLWFAFFDAPKGAQAEVYCGATSLAQAQEVFNAARQFVDNQPVFQALGVTAMKQSIFNASGSKFQSVVGRGRHGPKPRLFILDELHQSISDDLYGTAKTGCNKVVNSLLLVISTAGVASISNPCFALQERAQKALEGSLPDDRLFAALYCADDSVQWSSPEALRMANPNLGISNDAEKLAIAIQDALRSPAQQANVRAMHLNQWVSAASPWLNMEAWKLCHDPAFTEETVKDLPCWIGADFAIKIDLTCCVRLWRDDSKGDKPHYYAKVRTYLPQRQVDLPENGHFRAFVANKWLTATPGSSTELATVEADVIADCKANKTQAIAFDIRNAERSLQIITEQTGVTAIEMPPRIDTFSPPMHELEVAIADGRMHHDGNPILAWCLSNVNTRKLALGDYTTPNKSREENKIDAAVALLMALARARLATPKPVNTIRYRGLRTV